MRRLEAERIEERRLQEQAQLDRLKTAAERNKWGQFATPPELALTIARYARRLMEDRPIRFLDPAIGTGAFFSALLRAFPSGRIRAASGVELDPVFAKAAESLWSGSVLTVTAADFTKVRPPHERFNLILTNPPYVRHHHLSAADKARLKAEAVQSLRLDLSGLSGLYCYFLLLCDQWMEAGGVAAWLIPSEFMEVKYGSVLRRYLSERVTLLHIHRFQPEDVQFADALVSSAVVVFRKSPPPAAHKVRFSLSGTLEHPQTEALVSLEALTNSRKWTQFPGRASVEAGGRVTLGDVFAIKRGLATGANGFFILSEAEIDSWRIPRVFLRPILPGPRHVNSEVVGALPDGGPDVSPRLFLLDCSESEERIMRQWPRFYEYLQRGRSQHVPDSYLASRRVPWYSQEQRPPAPFLCTYMGRQRDGRHPFRFIWNRSQATAHNVYLMMYPKSQLRDALKKRPGLEATVFDELQRIAPAAMLMESRVYGGGLHKLEPSELANLDATAFAERLDIAFPAQTALFT